MSKPMRLYKTCNSLQTLRRKKNIPELGKKSHYKYFAMIDQQNQNNYPSPENACTPE